uniref:Decapping nuclease n=1 Tax=Acrobeloides nanus TaxID=290746 RepID=A0A914CI93_9BILA
MESINQNPKWHFKWTSDEEEKRDLSRYFDKNRPENPLFIKDLLLNLLRELPEEEVKKLLEDVQICTYRGLFKRILQTPYLKHGFNFQAHYNNVYNIIYLHEYEESDQEKTAYEKDRKNRYMGSQFEKLVTIESEKNENNPSKNYVPPHLRTQPKEKTYIIGKKNFKKEEKNIGCLYTCEIDCIDPETKCKLELKSTQKTIYEANEANTGDLRGKLREKRKRSLGFWTQCFLTNIKKVILGLKIPSMNPDKQRSDSVYSRLSLYIPPHRRRAESLMSTKSEMLPAQTNHKQEPVVILDEVLEVPVEEFLSNFLPDWNKDHGVDFLYEILAKILELIKKNPEVKLNVEYQAGTAEVIITKIEDHDHNK